MFNSRNCDSTLGILGTNIQFPYPETVDCFTSDTTTSAKNKEHQNR